MVPLEVAEVPPEVPSEHPSPGAVPVAPDHSEAQGDPVRVLVRWRHARLLGRLERVEQAGLRKQQLSMAN